MYFSRLLARAGRGVRTKSAGRTPQSKTLRLEALEPRIALAAAGLVPVGSQPTGPLTGTIVFTSPGHGWEWSASKGRFDTDDRADYNEVLEPFGNQDQMTAYVDYLFRAGATIVPMRPVGRQINEVVLDNDSAGVTFTGSWSNSTSTRYYDEDYGAAADTAPYRFASTTTGAETATATYTPNIPAAGMYPVYTWVLRGTDRVNQLYEINHTGGQTQVRVNHSMVGSGWVYLGTYHFDAGSSMSAGSVQISNNVTTPGGVVIADAIRFGNGMGDYVEAGAPGVSGKPREDEVSYNWIARMTGVGTSLAAAIGSGASNVSAPSNMAQYMFDGSFGEAVYIGFHSNGGGGRGAVGLIDADVGDRTPHQSDLATYLGRQINQDMQALNGQFEYNWSNRTTHTYTSQFGEIDLGTSGEMDATIIEVAFHDSVEDAAIMRDPKGRDAIARAVYQGTLEYFDNWGGLASPVSVATPPVNVRAVSNASGAATVSWNAGPSTPAGVNGGAATGFRVYASSDGYGFDGGTFVAGGGATSLTLTGYDPTLPYYFRVVAVNAGGESKPSEVATALPSGGVKQVLIVNGFDRFDRTQNFRYAVSVPAIAPDGLVDRVWPRYNNSFDYVVQFHTAIHAAKPGVHVASAGNEAVISGAVNLADYDSVIWILGNESEANDTFNATEQTKVSQFIAAGGNLFLSGSEIAFDLDQQNNGRTFFETTLKGNYVSDDAGTYTANAAAGGIFAGMSSFIFSSGSPSTGANAYSTRDSQLYNVATPDVIAAQAGALVALSYSNGAGAAAIQVQGVGGAGNIVMFAFPFETMTDAARRQTAMGEILEFFNQAPPVPTVDLKTRINGHDADSAPGEIFAVGSTANISYIVTNPGGVAIGNIVLTDDNGTPGTPGDDFNPTFDGGDANGNSTLDVGETWTYSTSRIVVAGQQSSSGSVSGLFEGSPIVDADSAYFFGSAPAVALHSLVNGDDADLAPGPSLAVGSMANLTYSVTNLGNTALSNVLLFDDNGTPGISGDNFSPLLMSGDVNGDGLLDVGETWLYSASLVVTPGQHTHAATVVAFDPLFEILLQVDSANYVGTGPSTADFDGSGQVDGFDFLAWQLGFGKAGDAVLGDGDGDGDHNVDGSDFALWTAAFGDPASVAASSSALVIEGESEAKPQAATFVPPLLLDGARAETAYIDFGRRVASSFGVRESGHGFERFDFISDQRSTDSNRRRPVQDNAIPRVDADAWASCVDDAFGAADKDAESKLVQ